MISLGRWSDCHAILNKPKPTNESTFAETEILEAGFDVRAESLDRPLRGAEAVSVDHHADQVRMPSFLLALQGQCLWIVVDIGLRKVRAESIAML